MDGSLLADAFAHHTWATVRLIDACEQLASDQRDATVPGTYGSILDTLRHLVGTDAFYLAVADGGRSTPVDVGPMDLPALREAMEAIGQGWAHLLQQDLDPGAVMREVDPDDGFTRDTPLGILLAEQLSHGAEHRAHVCTILGALRLPVPQLSGFDYGIEHGRVAEWYPQKD